MCIYVPPAAEVFMAKTNRESESSLPLRSREAALFEPCMMCMFCRRPCRKPSKRTAGGWTHEVPFITCRWRCGSHAIARHTPRATFDLCVRLNPAMAAPVGSSWRAGPPAALRPMRAACGMLLLLLPVLTGGADDARRGPPDLPGWSFAKSHEVPGSQGAYWQATPEAARAAGVIGSGSGLAASSLHLRHVRRLAQPNTTIPSLTQHVDASTYSSVCCIVKDEGPRLWEFVQYHSWLGFGKIYILDHNSTHPHLDVVSEHVRSGAAEYYFFSGGFEGRGRGTGKEVLCVGVGWRGEGTFHVQAWHALTLAMATLCHAAAAPSLQLRLGSPSLGPPLAARLPATPPPPPKSPTPPPPAWRPCASRHAAPPPILLRSRYLSLPKCCRLRPRVCPGVADTLW